MEKFKVKVRYDYGHFGTLGEVQVESRTEKAAKTKALKIARKRMRQEKMKMVELV
jgi:hypothetical protein